MMNAVGRVQSIWLMSTASGLRWVATTWYPSLLALSTHSCREAGPGEERQGRVKQGNGWPQVGGCVTWLACEEGQAADRWLARAAAHAHPCAHAHLGAVEDLHIEPLVGACKETEPAGSTDPDQHGQARMCTCRPPPAALRVLCLYRSSRVLRMTCSAPNPRAARQLGQHVNWPPMPGCRRGGHGVAAPGAPPLPSLTVGAAAHRGQVSHVVDAFHNGQHVEGAGSADLQGRRVGHTRARGRATGDLAAVQRPAPPHPLDALDPVLRHEWGEGVHHLLPADGQPLGNLKLILQQARHSRQVSVAAAASRIQPAIEAAP